MKKNILNLAAVALVFVLTACAPRIYGVPQEQWDVMSEKERIAAMDAYKERQIAYRKAATERARIRAEQETARQARLEAELQRRHERADLIYRGRAGTYGDLIEVTLHQGQMRLNYKKRHYSPVTFKLADGEIKSIPIHFSRGRQAELWVLYENRHLWIDIDPYRLDTRRGAHLVYHDDWASGITYTGINSHGSRDLRGINVDIDVVPLRHRRKHAGPKPVVIVREKIVRSPSRVIVREKNIEKPMKVESREVHADSGDRHARHGDHGTTRPGKPEFHGKELESSYEKHPSRKPGKNQESKSVVRVVLNGGKILVDGKRRPFEPVVFELIEGEMKTISLAGKGRKNEPFSRNVTALYLEEQLFLDGESVVEGPGQKLSAGRKTPDGRHQSDEKFRDIRVDIRKSH